MLILFLGSVESMVISVQIYVELFKFVAHFIRQISPPINAKQIISEINVDLLVRLGNLFICAISPGFFLSRAIASLAFSSHAERMG